MIQISGHADRKPKFSLSHWKIENTCCNDWLTVVHAESKIERYRTAAPCYQTIRLINIHKLIYLLEFLMVNGALQYHHTFKRSTPTMGYFKGMEKK